MNRLIQIPPDVQIRIVDEPEVFAQAKASGSCLITTLASGIQGADYYIEKAEDVDELSEDFFRRVYDRFCGRPHIIGRDGDILLRERTGEDYEFILWLYAFHAGEFLSADMEEEKVLRAQAKWRKRYFDYVSQSAGYQSMERSLFEAQQREEYQFFDFGLWLIEYKGKAVGLAGLEAVQMGVTIGYLLAPEYRNKGIATAACRIALKYAKEELDIREVFCLVHPNNKPSLQVAERLGFSEIMSDRIPVHIENGQNLVILHRILKEQ